MNEHLDSHEKAKQARIMLVDRMKKIRVQKDSDKPKNKQSKNNQVSKESHTGRTHGSHIDMCT
eukprot:12153744-Heterocapsa_arctica.AAC.1